MQPGSEETVSASSSPGRSARRITIAGGGIAALEAVLALRAVAPELQIELLAPRAAFEYTPLSVLEPFAIGETPELDLARFATEQHVAVRRETLAAVDVDARAIVTGRGTREEFDILLVATGAVPVDGVPGAQPFRGRRDYDRIALLLEEYDRGRLRRLAFAVPSSASWTLPVYELALLAARELESRGARGAELAIVTPEDAPLALFGSPASSEVSRLLREARISLHTSTHPQRFHAGVLEIVPEGTLHTDRVISLPRLVGPRFTGLPSDGDGFIPTDEHGLVSGADDVYAAGDITTFPIKQGGIACQQADAAATAIAARAGVPVEPEPFRPVLRGLLLSGRTARYLEAEPSGGRGEGAAPRFALWEPSSKVFGRHLLPYLWRKAGREPPPSTPHGEQAVPVELDIGNAVAGGTR